PQCEENREGELAELQRVCGGLEAGRRAKVLAPHPPAGCRLEEPEGYGDRRARCSRNQRPIGKAEAHRPRWAAAKSGKDCSNPAARPSLARTEDAYLSALPDRLGAVAPQACHPMCAGYDDSGLTKNSLASSKRRAIRAPSVGCSSSVSASHSLRAMAKKSPP